MFSQPEARTRPRPCFAGKLQPMGFILLLIHTRNLHRLGVLNLEPLPREHRPRPTKWKDSENDSVTLQPPKNVHILGAENVHELSTILCTGKLETLKFTDQQT